MTLQELQKATLGPYRWRTNIMKHAQVASDVTGTVNWEPRHEKGIDLEIGAERQELYLVPGGRFLITSDVNCLRLWDLGLPWMPALAHPVLLAEKVIRHEIGGSASRIIGEVLEDRIVRVIVSASDTDCK